MDKFQNKYRIPSARLQSWDYGSNGAYFITICTHDRQHFFGKIIDGEMRLNDMGMIAESTWMEIPNQFPFITLGNFVIMPNHMHGILIIDKSGADDGDDRGAQTRLIASISDPDSDSDPKTGGITGNKNPMIHDNISRAIRWYKGRCSYDIRKFEPDFAWQTRFHDHIIRDAISFDRIQNYIANNPRNWKEDTFWK